MKVLEELPERYISMYQRLFPPLPVSGRPLDIWENSPYLLWGMHPGEADGDYALFGVFDVQGDGLRNVRLNLDEVAARCRGWNKPENAPQDYLLWDFWEQKLIKSDKEKMELPLRAKSCYLFSLRPNLGRPQLLGTSGHFSQGVIETRGITWNAQKMQLSGNVLGNGGDPSTLFFHLPKGTQVTSAKLKGEDIKTRQIEPGVLAIDLPALNSMTPLALSFKGTFAPAATRPFEQGRAATRFVKSKKPLTTLKETPISRANSVHGKALSLLPKNKKWKLVWNDEFEGTKLDDTKWNYRLNYWGYKSPTFTKEGVEIKDGQLKISLVRKGDNFYSAHLQTGSNTFDIPRDPKSKSFWMFGPKLPAKFMHKFGYYEIRCKLPRNDGWHAAFWLQSPSIGAHPNPKYAGVECDIMENYRQHTDGTIGCGNGWGGYGRESKWYGHFWFPYEDTDDGWHYYGVDWSPEGYVFYADGKMVGKQMAPECAVSEVEQFLLVSTECHGYHKSLNRGGLEAKDPGGWNGKPVPALLEAKLPDAFIVDFVRVYDEVK